MKRGKMKKMRKYGILYLMASPGLIYLFINNYIPMAGLVVAFKNFQSKKGIFGSDWVGFKNFTFLFRTSDALVITRNTILYNLVFIALGTVVAVALAIFYSSVSRKASAFFQSAILLPNLISWVIISYLVFAFLSADTGFVNNVVLKLFGLKGINWYNEAKCWPFILVFVYLWQSVGYTGIVYYASVIGIDRGYYEVADLEGATAWKKIRYITLPLMKPAIVTMVLLSVGRIFYSDFGLFYQVPMNSGTIYSTTNVIDTYVYRGLMQQGNIGMSAAAGVYQSAVSLVIVLIAQFCARKIDEPSALF